MEEMVMVLQGYTPSNYVIRVWDCRGWLVHEDMHELPEEAVWLKCGHFYVPIRRDELQFVTERLKRKLEVKLFEILRRRGGAINWSGIYRVSVEELFELDNIFEKYMKKTEEIPNLSCIF